MSNAERVTLWVVWAAVTGVAVVAPLVWLASLRLRPDGEAALALALSPIGAVAFLAIVCSDVSFGLWVLRKTRKGAQ